MLERAVRYYVEPFCGERGVTQGGPLLPNIFNVVVEAVVRHSGSMVVEGDGVNGRDNIIGNEADHPEIQTIRACNNRKRRTEGGHTQLKVQAVSVYAYYRMVASNRPVWLQTAFYTLTGLFDWVGFNTNVWKTVGMVYHPC